MSTIQTDARFLGVDLHVLWREVCQAWSDAQNLPPLSWLTPTASVALLHADGGETFWRGDTQPEVPGKSVKTRFIALELPEDMVLRRSLNLPAVSDADMASAVALQAQAISPFAASDLVWGYRARPLAEGGSLVNIALASRRQVAHYVQARSSRLGPDSQPEIWATQPAAAPIVLNGYGETLRKAHGVRWRRVNYALLGLAAATAAAMAVTPSLQLRARALEALAAHEGTVQRTAPLVKEREVLMQSAEKLGALNEMLAGRIEPLRVLDRLTQVLPDDTALQSFSLKGQKVTLAGLTANASVVMRVLGEQAGMRDVRAPSPATRIGGEAAKENFVVEFTLDPQAFGVVAAATPAGAAVAPQNESTATPDSAKEAAPEPPPLRFPTLNQGAASGLVPSFGGGTRPVSPPAKPARAASEAKGTP